MYNTKRLKDVKITMEDCLIKLDKFEDIYKRANNDHEMELFLEEGFRGYIKGFQEQVIKYMAHTSKGLYNKKDKLEYRDILNKHIEAGLFEGVDYNFLVELRYGRNEFAHGYESPDFQQIFEFFKSNRDEFNKIIDSLDKVIRS